MALDIVRPCMIWHDKCTRPIIDDKTHIGNSYTFGIVSSEL